MVLPHGWLTSWMWGANVFLMKWMVGVVTSTGKYDLFKRQCKIDTRKDACVCVCSISGKSTPTQCAGVLIGPSVN